MTTPNASSAAVHWSVQGMLVEYLTSGRLAEVVYRDSAGQIRMVHDVIRDLFSRAGHEYILLGRGSMVSLDHIITLDGRTLAVSR
ncbi:hypothetical protein [Marinobacter similis]|uniref:Rho-binding antiterminator n=1 Tax=Marinobacter similis TaxID=1420916 RepID=W5YH96_9GAMM|nr:hypothetical protein [Marinobacter similis]AHI28375.1 hypothetical protein AU14_06375 [Marinobacter similis]